jgi:hypothetical protein
VTGGHGVVVERGAAFVCVSESIESFLAYWRLKRGRDLTEGNNEGKDASARHPSGLFARFGSGLGVHLSSLSSVGAAGCVGNGGFRSVVSATVVSAIESWRDCAVVILYEQS